MLLMFPPFFEQKNERNILEHQLKRVISIQRIKSNKFQSYSNKMMQRIPFGSPAKQNIHSSPTHKRRNDLLSELIAFLKLSPSLPPHIAHLITINPESPLKQRNSHDEGKRLKVQLSQCEFELKKLEEDFAEFRRQAKLERERENKKYQEQLAKLRSCLEASTENSSYKLEKMALDHEAEKKAMRQKQKLQLDQEVAKVKEALQTKLDSEEKLKKREITELVRAHTLKLAEVTKNHQETIALLQQRSENDLQEVKMKHRSVLEEKERRHESMRVALESERRTEEKLHEKTKLEASKDKEKLICELCFEKNTRAQLEEEAVNREKEIKKLKSTINDLKVDLQLLEDKSKKKAEQMMKEYEVKHQQALKGYQESLKRVMESHADELSQLEVRLNKMEETHLAKVELMAQSAEELACSFERRPSKPQDLSEIDKLKWALTKKEDEVRKLMRDLKHCNLQLENKEEIYTRIFRGNSMSREKRTPKEKDEREQLCIEEKLGKESAFRKSQTADVKYLLKIYNNTKNA